MDSFAGCTPRNFISFYLDEATVGQPTQTSVEAKENPGPDHVNTIAASNLPSASDLEQFKNMDTGSDRPRAPAASSLLSKLLISDSCELSESCQSLFTRRMQKLGADSPNEETPADAIGAQRESHSELITITPGCNQSGHPRDQVTSLDSAPHPTNESD